MGCKRSHVQVVSPRYYLENLKYMNIGTVFDTISYMVPGFVSLYLFLISTNIFEKFPSVYVLILPAYIIGNVLHSLSYISVKSILWNVYHNWKDKDESGHGVKIPTTIKGKIANFLRYRVIKVPIEKIKAYENEIWLIKNRMDLFKHFEYLSYQKILNSSLALIFYIYSLFLMLKMIIGTSEMIRLNFNGFEITLSIYVLLFISILLGIVFHSRERFFVSYKNNIFDKIANGK